MNSPTRAKIFIPVWGTGTTDRLSDLATLARSSPCVSLVPIYRRLAAAYGTPAGVARAPLDFIGYTIQTALDDGVAVAETESPDWRWEVEDGAAGERLLSAAEIREELIRRARRAGIVVEELPLSRRDFTGLLTEPVQARLLSSGANVLLDIESNPLGTVIDQIVHKLFPYHGSLLQLGQLRVRQTIMHSPVQLLRAGGISTHVIGVGHSYKLVIALGKPSEVRRLESDRRLWSYAGLGFVAVPAGAGAFAIHGGEPLVQHLEPTPSGEVRDRLPASTGRIATEEALPQMIATIALPPLRRP
jgi:hypothetical protein